MLKLLVSAGVAVGLVMAMPMDAQTVSCERPFDLEQSQPYCPPIDTPPPELDPLRIRLERYVDIEARHRMAGLASYYSTSLDGTLTANGERFRNRKMTAAHLTLPLGCWVEVTSRATGRTIRVRVNDRGPYVKKFCLDLSQAAAHALGVDVAEDRFVEIRIVGLPGEEPLPQHYELALAPAPFEEQSSKAGAQ